MSASRLLFAVALASCLQAAPGILDVRAICKSDGAAQPRINVYFNLPAPSATDVTDAGNWRIRYFYAPGTPAHTAEIEPPAGTSGLASSGRVDLPLRAVPAGAISVLVQYSGPGAGSSFTATLPCPDANTKREQYKAASGKDDSDIYISGGYSPATATTPVFSADVNLGFRSPITGSTSWQAVGSLKTDNRKKADPDSFRFRGSWVYDSPMALAWSANIGGGMEFDRQGRARNVVASPRFSFVPLAGVKKSTDGKPLAAAALEIRGGIETGRNTNPTFRFNNVNFEGTEGIFRGVPGASFYLNVFDPTIFHVKFKKISVVSSYDVRLLTKPEIFLETRTPATDPIPQLRSQPRNKTATDIAFKVTDALGFSIKYEHGSLPPSFVHVRNKLTFGILLQLKESRGMRP